MTDKEFLTNALYDDFLKAAKVNMQTGEYLFLKVFPSEQELGCLKAGTIEEYAQSIVENGLIYPEDVPSYLKHMSLSYLQRRVAHNRRRVVHSFRRKFGAIFKWVTFEVTVPKCFTQENPWVILTWKESDSDSCALEDAMRMLSAIYHKILKVNLTLDTQEEIKGYGGEDAQSRRMGFHVSESFQSFVSVGNVYDADVEDFLAFTDMERLRRNFRESKECIRYRYRRKTGNMFRWVSMELLPSIEYTDDNQIVMLYIRDIHDDYIAELHRQKELEYYCNYDILTGIWNRYYYKNYCLDFAKRKEKPAIAVIFADVNGLKYVNDTFGHEQGDAYLKEFSRLLADTFGMRACCRISGDEFLVLLEDVTKDNAKKKVVAFHNYLWQQERPTAAIGFAWQDGPDSLDELVRDAETQMYSDKQEYYKKYPKYARG